MLKGNIFSDWNLRVFGKSGIWLKLNNIGVHSSLARSELCLSTENQSSKCSWEQAEDRSGHILLSLLGCFL